MTKPPSPRPLSITLIGGLWQIASYVLLVASLYVFWQTSPRGVETPTGVPLANWKDVSILLASSFLSSYLGLGLLHLNKFVRRIAIPMLGACLVAAMYGVAVLVTSKGKAGYIRFDDAGDFVAVNPSPRALDTHFGQVELAVCLFMIGFLATSIWFLIKRKSAFVKPATAPPAS